MSHTPTLVQWFGALNLIDLDYGTVPLPTGWNRLIGLVRSMSKQRMDVVPFCAHVRSTIGSDTRSGVGG
jgi:hypothetical protein